MTAPRGEVEVEGGTVRYRVLGSGERTLVLLHGGPGGGSLYLKPLERLAAADRRVVLYDQLGCGSSDRPDDVDWTLELFTDEVVAVREQLGLERVHLLGTSWGGMLALEHALSGRGELTSLILSSTLASIDEWAAEQKRLVADLPLDVREVLARHEQAGTYGDPEYEQAMEVYFDRHFYRGPKPRPELERMQAGRGKEAYRGMVGPNEWTVTGALRGWDVRERLGEIRVPTLVVRGAHDMSTEAVNETLLRGIPHAESVVLEESSHTPVLEETERYLTVVREFIRDAEA